MLAEEGYARAGGLMSVVPIFYTALMLHESIPLSAKVERTPGLAADLLDRSGIEDRKSTRLNSSHVSISYAVFCLKKKNKRPQATASVERRSGWRTAGWNS